MNETSSSLSTRCKLFIQSHRALLTILIVAAFVWALVFFVAASDYLLMRSWNGTGHFDIFGLTVHFEFEGWSDYAYYYQTWGDQFLNGYIPYTDAFDNAAPDQYAPYFFPPLYLYLCALGNALPIDPFGTALLICLFGYATAFPVYGIAEYLSQNKRVGEIAAATYLLNPLILYHTVYEWLNPAPFVFFLMMSFYLLMKHHRIAGTLAMVTAALFKQTVFFLALPLIAYLIKTPPAKELSDHDPETSEEYELIAGDNLDVLGFIRMAVIVLVYAVVISLPYIIDYGNYIFYILLKPGMTLLDSVTVIPESNIPMTFAVLFIVMGAPEPVAQFFNLATAYSVFLFIGILVLLVPMLFEVKDDRNLRSYWRRMLFLSILLLLVVHIFSPRGVYKYYFVALIPLFSILSGERMISHGTKKIQASLSMVINPLIITALILIPNRYVYLGLLLLVMMSYILNKQFGDVYYLITKPLSQSIRKFKSRIINSGHENITS
jgi:hypothetical protein